MIGNGNSANLLARVGNQSARGRKYNPEALSPSERKKAAQWSDLLGYAK